MPKTQTNQKIVTIGGGTGSFTLLSGLKKYPVELSAIVSMADDGGSTGRLRDELGVLPPGDVRQCLVALSGSSRTLRELFNYRFAGGGLSGHNFGNLFLSALEKITGRFDLAVKKAGELLAIRGEVIPVTLANTKLTAELDDGKKIKGEYKINGSKITDKIRRLALFPRARANPEAIRAIGEADKIVICPGNLYCSILPNLLVRGIASAIGKSRAKKIYVCNLMNKAGHTDGFAVSDYLREIEGYLGDNVIDLVIYNKERPEERLMKKYAAKGEYFVADGKTKKRSGAKFIGLNLLSRKKYRQARRGDALKRTLVRHDSAKIAEIIVSS